jgi:hypothetical protein
VENLGRILGDKLDEFVVFSFPVSGMESVLRYPLPIRCIRISGIAEN